MSRLGQSDEAPTAPHPLQIAASIRLIAGLALAACLRGGCGSGGSPAYRPYRIQVNGAGTDELRLLPGVGAALARRIVRARWLDGPFESPADLERVRGVGPALRRRIGRHARFQ